MNAFSELFDFLLRLFGLRKEVPPTSEYVATEDTATVAPDEGPTDPVVQVSDPTDGTGGDTAPEEPSDPGTTDTSDPGTSDPVTSGDTTDPTVPDGGTTTTTTGGDPTDPVTGGGDPTDPVTGGGDPTDPPPTTPTFETNDGGTSRIVTLQSDTASVEVIEGRVTTFEHDGDVASVKVTVRPEHGNLTVNPDNTLALVLSGDTYTGPLSFSYEVTYADGSVETVTQSVNVTEGPQDAGWGTGDFYMLETDADGDLVIEHGENHREVYVSGSEDALSIADIAALEGIPESSITAAWLVEHPDYGGSEDMALASDSGMLLWKHITDDIQGPQSNWLLLECGYEYPDLGRIVSRGTIGESELHPIYIGSYGEGADPVVPDQLKIFQDESQNVVIQGIDFGDGAFIYGNSNILLSDLTFAGEGVVVSVGENITIRETEFLDIHKDAPGNGTTWAPHADRVSGLYVSDVDGLLLDGIFMDMIGWEEGYDPNGSGAYPQPPSMFSQGIYIQHSSLDVTLRDSIIMRAASFGAQVRSGGFIEDNVFIDGNGGVNSLGGYAYTDGTDARTGNYTLMADNVITSAGHKEADMIGALSWGADNQGYLTTYVDNVIAHLADPNNPDEQAEKYNDGVALQTKSDFYYDDTIVHNWVGSSYDDNTDKDINTDGLDMATLDQTTIQIFTAQLLGTETATIEDLANYLRAQADGAFDDVVDADLIIAFFQQGFGLTPDIRAEAETLRFVPNDLGDGIRWDNRLNWTTGDLPGTQDGDSVDLAGNWVYYGGLTTNIHDLDFGSGGRLAVTSGYLGLDGAMSAGDWGGELIVDGSGQFWGNGYSDEDLLDIDVLGGRFANTGEHGGHTELTVGDNGQAILATDDAAMRLDDGDFLEIIGGGAQVGFDGEMGGTAVLDMSAGAVLSFVSENGEIGMIEEFRSGHFGDASNVQSGVDLGGSTLVIDLSGLTEATEATLIEVDQLIGSFGSYEITGLGGDRDATLVVDYDTDRMTLSLGAAGTGTGQVTFDYVGDEAGAMADAELWASLTLDPDTLVDPALEEDLVDPVVIAA